MSSDLEVQEAFEAWSKEGRTDEQKWAVKNFLTSRHYTKLIADARIDELKDVRPGKDSDVMHLRQVIDNRLAELEQATKPEKGDSPRYGTIIHRKGEDGSSEQSL